MFGQGRDQAELLDNTTILLSLDQLRQVGIKLADTHSDLKFHSHMHYHVHV